MQIPAALAAELARLSEALDEPGLDLAVTIAQLAADATMAVSSYLGLSVVIDLAGQPVTFTVLQDDVTPSEIQTSLRMSLLSPATSISPDPAASVVLVLYAAHPGAFTDMAADLTWLTGTERAGFSLDIDLALPALDASTDALRNASTLNQAVGVLIGEGKTPGQAASYIGSLATGLNINDAQAAASILDQLRPPT